MKLGKIELLKKQKMGETQIIDYYNGTEQQKEENKKLKEENEKIKKMNESLKKILKKKHPLPPSDLPEKLNKIIEELKEENKELKEAQRPSLKQSLSEAMKENGSWMTDMKKDYEVQLRTQKDMVSMYSRKYRELKEENKKLKEKADAENTITMINKLNEECGRVVEENEKFKKEIEEGVTEKVTLYNEWLKLKENYDEVKEYASHSQWGEHPLEDHDHLLSRISYLTDEETEYSVLQENYERIIAILERTECSPVFHQDIDETDVPDIIQKILELIDMVGIGFKMTKTEGD